MCTPTRPMDLSVASASTLAVESHLHLIDRLPSTLSPDELHLAHVLSTLARLDKPFDHPFNGPLLEQASHERPLPLAIETDCEQTYPADLCFFHKLQRTAHLRFGFNVKATLAAIRNILWSPSEIDALSVHFHANPLDEHVLAVSSLRF